jgi:hypothetical protein
MVTVGIYIYINGLARRIELFDDEKISLNSSVQDASDISKVYTDFSQSFTVPANDHNNAIFSHWYENSIDGGFDARKRKKAYIELDTIPFRNGNIQLEKATIKNGVPENYTITFFGSLVSLKDIFANKKLSELDYSAHTINYTPTKVIDSVKGEVNNDVKFPLITSNRLWSDTGVENITTSGKAIEYSELFPALRISKIFESIADFYNIKFEGDFLSDPRFTRAFLWLKNADVFKAKSTPLDIDFVNFTFDDDIINPAQNPVVVPNVSANSFTFNGLGWYNSLGYGNTYFAYINSSFYIDTNENGINCTLNVYRDNVLFVSIPFVSQNTPTSEGVGYPFLGYSFPVGTGIPTLPLGERDTNLVGNYTFKIISENPITFTSYIKNEIGFVGIEEGSETIIIDNLIIENLSGQFTTSQLNLASYMPDIKVEDFFSGILKMFNLTCLSYEENKYVIKQLEDWYNEGSIENITQYVISDDLEISKLETFKNINFNYTKSESFMNVNYLGNNGFEYGNLRADLDAEGTDYTVQLPFENLLFNKFTGQNLQLGYALKTDFKAYIPKPVILYDYGTLQTCNFYLKGSSTPVNITFYNAFGQDTLLGSVNQSLNFGIEISSLLLIPISNTLYSNYYQSYLENIYNLKSRKYNVKAVLPISLLTYLKLNNRLVIRDKRYIINNMKIDLTSGEVDFELINDFRGEFIPQPPIPLAFDYSPTDYTEDYFIN